MNLTRRPRDLGNDQFSVRCDPDGRLIAFEMRAQPDLKSQDGRKMLRRMIRRGLELAFWFEAHQNGNGK